MKKTYLYETPRRSTEPEILPSRRSYSARVWYYIQPRTPHWSSNKLSFCTDLLYNVLACVVCVEVLLFVGWVFGAMGFALFESIRAHGHVSTEVVQHYSFVHWQNIHSSPFVFSTPYSGRPSETIELSHYGSHGFGLLVTAGWRWNDLLYRVSWDSFWSLNSLFLEPLYSMFRMLPYIGWNGLPESAICAALAPGTDAVHWNLHKAQCDKLVTNNLRPKVFYFLGACGCLYLYILNCQKQAQTLTRLLDRLRSPSYEQNLKRFNETPMPAMRRQVSFRSLASGGSMEPTK